MFISMINLFCLTCKVIHLFVYGILNLIIYWTDYYSIKNIFFCSVNNRDNGMALTILIIFINKKMY